MAIFKRNDHGDTIGLAGGGYRLVSVACAIIIGFFVFGFCTETVEQGTVKAAYRWGSYQYTLNPGFHLVNPLNDFHEVNTKQQTVKYEQVELPTQDQLVSKADVSIQYRAINTSAETIVSDNGDLNAVIANQLEPKARSTIREVGKTVVKAEDLFLEATQIKLQNEIKTRLAAFMQSKGVLIQAVLLRDTTLPQFIVEAIHKKKENEQKALQQVAELQRFETEQQQKVKQAEAERDAANFAAEQVKIKADAAAYAIGVEGKALAANPAILRLRALDTLSNMAKDPAAKIFWMDASAPNPLPLMNIGDKIK